MHRQYSTRTRPHTSHLQNWNWDWKCDVSASVCVCARLMYTFKTFSIIHFFINHFWFCVNLAHYTHAQTKMSHKANTIQTPNWISNWVRVWVLRMFRSFFIFFVFVFFLLCQYKCMYVMWIVLWKQNKFFDVNFNFNVLFMCVNMCAHGLTQTTSACDNARESEKARKGERGRGDHFEITFPPVQINAWYKRFAITRLLSTLERVHPLKVAQHESLFHYWTK